MRRFLLVSWPLAGLFAVGTYGIAGCGPSALGDLPDATPAPIEVPPPDEDHDTIRDEDEDRAASLDTDGDATPDFRDLDSDADGVPDRQEVDDEDPRTRPPDADGDGRPDFRDTDADANGIPDGQDSHFDTDGDGNLDFRDVDDDGDFLWDSVEMGSDPWQPVDTDRDGLADYQDLDSDDDTIADRDELDADPDADGVPAYRDRDSDDDCRTDTSEAGDRDLRTPPRDGDQDAAPDFLDLDSDGDGLPDRTEDRNCNGRRDGTETSARAADSDKDRVSDLVELAAGTDPNDPKDNPQAYGDFVFGVPYDAPPSPRQDTLDFHTDIKQADVFFTIDTTGSMGEEIANLKAGLATIARGLAERIPSIALGVGGYEDIPAGTCGSLTAGDRPWYLLHRIMTVGTSAGLASVQAGVDALQSRSGGDGPESGWQALYQIATGRRFSYPAGTGTQTLPAFDPLTAPPIFRAEGESVGTLGGVGFRTGSLPIVVVVTDYFNHNSESYPEYDYGPAGCANVPEAATRGQAIRELSELGARVLAVVSQSDVYAAARDDLGAAVRGTGAVVPPSAWGNTARPAGCHVDQCCTAQGGTGESVDGDQCPLVFTVAPNGAGLGQAVVTAIQTLTDFTPIDIRADIVDDPTDGVDAVSAFVSRLLANPAAGAPCGAGLRVADADGDGVPDSFLGVNPGTVVCFDVVPKRNLSVRPTLFPQMFKATIRIQADAVTTVDTHDVYFLVPPEVPLYIP